MRGQIWRLLIAASTKSRLVMRIVQIVLFIAPLEAVSSVISDAKLEIRAISSRGFCFSQRTIVVRYDTQHSFPGLGDLFLLIMLANYLSALGNPCVFSTNLNIESQIHMTETRENRYARLISRFLAPSVILRIESSLPEGIEDYILLANRVSEGRDISAVAIQIMGRCYRNKRLNPGRIPPDLAKVIDSQIGRHPLEEKFTKVRRIGYHVRFSQHDHHRNPSLTIAIEDCIALMEAFPESRIIWFGEREQFDRFVAKCPQDSEFFSRVRYQASKSFEDAVVEAHHLDFWFQRFGGGIGAPLIFGSKPYLMMSRDPIATRYYFYTNRRIVPWARKDQKWFLLVNQDRTLRDVLRLHNYSRLA